MNRADDLDQAVPRCPRCLDHEHVERSGGWGHRWFCPACDLVFVGSAAEQQAESRRRADEERAQRERARRLGAAA